MHLDIIISTKVWHFAKVGLPIYKLTFLPDIKSIPDGGYFIAFVEIDYRLDEGAVSQSVRPYTEYVIDALSHRKNHRLVILGVPVPVVDKNNMREPTKQRISLLRQFNPELPTELSQSGQLFSDIYSFNKTTPELKTISTIMIQITWAGKLSIKLMIY